MSALQISEATRLAQSGASDPHRSVIVSANAGAGKTHVLTERVVRLLLAGAEPSKILCLTYTKAAAAEMSTRVFGRLSAWATAEEKVLADELSRLLGHRPIEAEIGAARRLFAEALETPGGLKIQTIHAFCEAILHQFPLEANVAGHFEVMDEAESALLLAEARRRLITGDGHPEEVRAAMAAAFSEALAFGGEWGLDALLSEIVSRRDALRRHMLEAGGLGAAVDFLRRGLGVAELFAAGDEAPEDALRLAAIAASPLAAVAPTLLDSARASGASSDAKLADRLAVLLGAGPSAARFDALGQLVLDSKGEVRRSIRGFATKAAAAVVPGIENVLGDAGEAFLDARERLASLRLARASAAALTVADRLEQDYAALKRRRGRLDFEDLIVRTADLLTRSEAASWVHYKLDRGIDHVLIDEAQDTSPRQWQVMRSLVEEFFVGASARPVNRTLFAVGDEKQSIYSFQGASPWMFAEERRTFRQKAEGAEKPFAEVELHQSFRSTAEVLAAVDRVFADEANRRGVSLESAPPSHSSARGAEPGLVEVWPVVQAEPAAEPDDWLAAVDVEPERSPSNRLARRIAGQIRAWLGQPITVKGKTRPLGPGDVLVLVRKRSAFVEAMAKALRDERIAVAGADRLVLTEHIAIQDLMAFGQAAANAEDELSLASALKSPLFGFTDDDLMALALSRRADDGLYLALRRLAQRGSSALPDFMDEGAKHLLLPKAKSAFERFEELRDRVGFEGVFTFYARILGPGGGRAALTGRLGPDAGEVVDAFLDLALAAEETGSPGLDAFLADLCASPPQIKREMEHGRPEVRIMTVHASKGLEAPVVFLVDPGSAPFSHAHGARLMAWGDMPDLYPGQSPGFLWRADKGLENAAIRRLKEEEKRLAGEEYRRLLYVGMTRAADRLVVCGTAGVRGADPDSWLQRVEAALRPVAQEIKDAAGETLAWRCGRIGSGPAAAPAELAAQTAPQMRKIDLSKLPPEALAPRPLSPSSAGGVHRLEADDDESLPGAPSRSPVLRGTTRYDDASVRRGTMAHRLLQVLPDLSPQDREAAGRKALDGLEGTDVAAREALLAEVLAVLADPRFAPVFAPGSRAEVSVAGTVQLGERSYAVAGTIDRLAVTAEEVLIVDYKTGRPAPADAAEAAPEHVLQLALYRSLVAPLYPGRRVRTALLFTEEGRLLDVPAARLEAALATRAGVSHLETRRSQGRLA